MMPPSSRPTGGRPAPGSSDSIIDGDDGVVDGIMPGRDDGRKVNATVARDAIIASAAKTRPTRRAGDESSLTRLPFIFEE